MTASCPICRKSFHDRIGVYQHAKAKHKRHNLDSLRMAASLPRDDDEPSMADRMIEAQLQHAMGGPVDEDWLLDAIT